MEGCGLIHIYTGDGKGKTTSAIGLATRALGGGLKVCYCSFHKRPERYGYTEMDSLRKLGARVENFAKGHPHLDRSLDPVVIKRETEEALDQIAEVIKGGDYQLLIMDEVLISVRDNYISEQQLLQFIDTKPEGLELVLTGRGATQAVMDRADYVSNIQKVKHPYDSGIMSRKGIEF
ncbi:MAG: cob(I)yrinic acid a,c-diamide adenosyltransferase [Rikenellaceae bacterium]